MPRLIDADALLKEDFTDSFVDHYDVAVFEAIIEKAPTIDPESLRPHGRWIPLFDGEHITPEYYGCSRCCRVEWRREPYCNCGAKMDEEEDNG